MSKNAVTVSVAFGGHYVRMEDVNIQLAAALMERWAHPGRKFDTRPFQLMSMGDPEGAVDVQINKLSELNVKIQ